MGDFLIKTLCCSLQLETRQVENGISPVGLGTGKCDRFEEPRPLLTHTHSGSKAFKAFTLPEVTMAFEKNGVTNAIKEFNKYYEE